MSDQMKASIRGDVERYFRFLHDFGFVVQSVDYHPKSFGNWEVVYASEECLVEISNDRDGIDLNFMPLNKDGTFRVGIKGMIYCVTQGQKFIDYFSPSPFPSRDEQMKELAILLKEYLAQIAPYFGSNYQAHKEEILSAEKKWNNFALQQMQIKIKAEKQAAEAARIASRKRTLSRMRNAIKLFFSKG